MTKQLEGRDGAQRASLARTVALETLGCKLNQAETEALAQGFRQRGYEIVASPQHASLYVLNTCTVTHVADRKARQLLRRARKATPGLFIVATGCYAQRAPKEVGRPPLVDLVVGNRDKPRLVGLVEEVLSRQGFSWQKGPLPARPDPGRRTRAFVKIQEGCHGVCAFCIVPRVRGRERSLPLDQIVAEVREKVRAGYREVVLTGTQVGSYRTPEGFTLRHLIAALLERTSIERLRVSSLQPQDIDEPLLELWRDRRLCRHFHVPLQSGSARVLQSMRRPYTLEQYRQRVERLRCLIPEVAITTDIIVGFPGEAAEEFAESCDFCREMAFAGMHVFPYSRRQGTAAARFADQVPEQVKGQRLEAMLVLAKENRNAYRRRFLDCVLEVLWEGEKPHPQAPQGTVRTGLTDNYLRVLAPSGQIEAHQITPARIVAVAEEGVWAQPLPPASRATKAAGGGCDALVEARFRGNR